MTHRWTTSDMPYLAGRTFVVTGANSGIGYEAAKALGAAGATVVMACRSHDRAVAARDAILSEHPDARLELVALDLADLESVRACATELRERFPTIDVLVNNAGLIGVRGKTAQGFEMTIGVNHLGHFALTGLVGDHVASGGSEPRVVHVASIAHSIFGRMRWNDLMYDTWWSTWPVYGQSKLCNLLFHHELQRRLSDAGAPMISVACHPGMSHTNLVSKAPRTEGANFVASVYEFGSKLTTQSAEMGALPTLYAATNPEITGGEYVGPSGPFEAHGHPKLVGCAARARRAEDMKRLWDVSVDLTGVDFGWLPA